MPMPTCVNHPDQPGTYTATIDGHRVDICLSCRLAMQDEEEEEDD